MGVPTVGVPGCAAALELERPKLDSLTVSLVHVRLRAAVTPDHTPNLKTATGPMCSATPESFATSNNHSASACVCCGIVGPERLMGVTRVAATHPVNLFLNFSRPCHMISVDVCIHCNQSVDVRPVSNQLRLQTANQTVRCLSVGMVSHYVVTRYVRTPVRNFDFSKTLPP